MANIFFLHKKIYHFILNGRVINQNEPPININEGRNWYGGTVGNDSCLSIYRNKDSTIIGKQRNALSLA